MEYFRIKQDPEYFCTLILPNVIKQIDQRHITPEYAHKIKDTTIFRLAEKEKPEPIDLVDRQLFLVSDKLRKLIRLYLPEIIFKTVIIVNHMQNIGYTYFLPIFPQIDCFSGNSIMTPDKSVIKRLVLKQAAGKIYPPVFQVKHRYEPVVIFRLDAAESLLRREFRGIKLYRVELDKKEQENNG